MKIVKNIFASALLALAFTSCNTGDGESVRPLPAYGMLNIINDNGAISYSAGSSSITMSSEKSADRLSISGVDGSGVWSFTNLTMSSGTDRLKWDLSATSQVTGCAVPARFGLYIVGALGVNNVTYNSYYDILFSDTNKRVVGVSSNWAYFSRTVVTEKDGGQQVITTDAADKNQYTLLFNSENITKDNRTLNIRIYGASFIQGMPAMVMEFQKIPFTVDANGAVQFEIASLTPYLVSNNSTTPQDRFPITNLRGAGNLYSGSGINLSFECKYTDKDNVSTDYVVVSSLSNNPPKTQDK